MERSTQIWIGVVVLAALAGGVYYKAKEDAKFGTSQTTAADLPDIKATDDVDKISITNAEKGEVVLEKKGDKWVVTKPVEAPANQTSVKALLDNMKDLKAKEVVVGSPTDDQKKEFQFADNKDLHLVTFKAGAKKLDVRFGKSGARGQMAMIEGNPGIYSVAGYSSYVYAREVKGWRDAEILKFEDASVIGLSIAKKGGTLSFTKAGDHWAGTFKDKAIERFDEEKVKDALRAFKALNAEDFGDGKREADTGLAEPESTVTIQLKDNAAKYVLKVGNLAKGTSRYVEKEGDPTIFVIAQYAADWALADATKFEKPLDGGAGDAGKKDGPKLTMPGMPGMPPGMGANPHGMGDPHGH
jgi:hypothetical protein